MSVQLVIMATQKRAEITINKMANINYWYLAATEKQKVDTKAWKDDLKNYLSISKEGVPVDNLNELLDNDGVGQIPFKKLGFKHLNHFLFECSDFLSLGKLFSGQLFLFNNQISPEVAHIAQLVKGQDRAKGTVKNPRPLRHQINTWLPLREIIEYSSRNDRARDYQPPLKHFPRKRRGGGRGSNIQKIAPRFSSISRPRRMPFNYNSGSEDTFNDEMDRWDFGGSFGNKATVDENEWEAVDIRSDRRKPNVVMNMSSGHVATSSAKSQGSQYASKLLVSQHAIKPLANNQFATKPLANNQFATKPLANNQFAAKPLANNQFATKPLANNQFAAKPLVNNQFATKPLANNQFAAKPLANNQFATKPLANNQFATKPLENNQFATKPLENNQFATKPLENNQFVTKPLANNQFATKPPANECATKPLATDYATKPLANNQFANKPPANECATKPLATDYTTKPLATEYASEPLANNEYATKPLASNQCAAKLIAYRYGEQWSGSPIGRGRGRGFPIERILRNPHPELLESPKVNMKDNQVEDISVMDAKNIVEREQSKEGRIMLTSVSSKKSYDIVDTGKIKRYLSNDNDQMTNDKKKDVVKVSRYINVAKNFEKSQNEASNVTLKVQEPLEPLGKPLSTERQCSQKNYFPATAAITTCTDSTERTKTVFETPLSPVAKVSRFPWNLPLNGGTATAAKSETSVNPISLTERINRTHTQNIEYVLRSPNDGQIMSNSSTAKARLSGIDTDLPIKPENPFTPASILKSKLNDSSASIASQLKHLTFSTPTKSDITTRLMPIDEKHPEKSLINCTISEITRSAKNFQFIISNHKTAEELKQIESEMEHLYNTDEGQFKIEGTPTTGCYGVYIPEWKKWVRCHLSRLPISSSGKSTVRLYDYCTHKLVSRENIRYLTKRFSLLPQQSYKAKLDTTCFATVEQLTSKHVGQNMTFQVSSVSLDSTSDKILTLTVANKKKWEMLCSASANDAEM